MTSEEIVKKLCELAQLDIDAVRAYEQAIKNIDDESIRAELESFCGDHHRHIEELGQAIHGLNGEPPKNTPDIKGFLIQGFTAIRSMTGDVGALKAMQSNEELTNKVYAEAEKWPVSADIKAIITRNRQDEVKHLTYIKGTLAKLAATA